MTARAEAIGWGSLAAAAAVAAFGPIGAQLTFAVVAIGLVGMAHGASDLAVVEQRQRPLFLALYALLSLACLAWWIAMPAIALPLFLMASAVHFGMEDAPASASGERLLRGLSLVATPATFYREALGGLLRLAGGGPGPSGDAMTAYALVGGVSAALLLGIAWRRGDGRLLTGTAVLLLLPPLVGFSAGFLILHALPQTAARRHLLRLSGTLAYLRLVAPVLAAAVVLTGAIGGALLTFEPSGIRSLFAAIAALAVPHLLVTPWFEGQAEGRIQAAAMAYPRLAA